jgi:rare lipoprotein A
MKSITLLIVYQITYIRNLSNSFFKSIFIAGFCLCMASCVSSKPNLGERGYVEEGQASYYARKFQGRTMANGQPYKRNKLTAAHKTLPFGTKVKVTNLATKETVKVHITDRGPFVKGRIIDLSEAAAKRLNFINIGVVPVRVKVVRPARK